MKKIDLFFIKHEWLGFLTEKLDPSETEFKIENAAKFTFSEASNFIESRGVRDFYRLIPAVQNEKN